MLARQDETCQAGYMKFKYVSGRQCLDFAGTLKHRRRSMAEELLTTPGRLSDWAVQGGLVDAAMDVTDDDLATAIALREAVYRIVSTKLEGGESSAPDIELVNEHAAQP